MKARSLLRDAVLWAVLAVMGLMQGCGPQSTGVAVITPDSQVRRLSPAVFAGSSQPLPELTGSSPLSLAAGGMVSTDNKGEAEVKIQGCLTLYVYQKGSLTRSTCRKSDAASGLGVCSTDGMTGVINQCLNKIDIQTPSASAQSNSTWYTVIYLPEDQLTIVQVMEGEVTVRPVIDPASDEWPEAQVLGSQSLWFTAPGPDAPVINGLTGRQALPLEDWQILRPALIERYPDLDMWMAAARQTAQRENLVFPEYLVSRTGEVNTRFVGQLWADDRIQRAMETGVDWKGIVQRVWPQINVFPSLLIHQDTYIFDAREVVFNRDESLKLLADAEFWQSAPTITIIAREEDPNAVLFANELHSALVDLDIRPLLQIASGSDFVKIADFLLQNPDTDSPYIWVETAGEAFMR